ncbi:MAG: FMN-binding protein [Oscillospiraceae bacterium]|nr:FMN-binding protein [Oscillospiraceae bacterium]
MKNDFVVPILVLTLICLVVTGALALMNSVTYPVIELAAAERALSAMAEKIPEATGFEPIENVVLPRAIRAAYRTKNDVGYIFIVSVNGFSGEIRVMCAIGPDGRILSNSTLQHTETRGIGTVIDDANFTDQFNGKDSRLDGIQAVSGATISTVAYINAMREAFAILETIRGLQ